MLQGASCPRFGCNCYRLLTGYVTSMCLGTCSWRRTNVRGLALLSLMRVKTRYTVL